MARGRGSFGVEVSLRAGLEVRVPPSARDRLRRLLARWMRSQGVDPVEVFRKVDERRRLFIDVYRKPRAGGFWYVGAPRSGPKAAPVRSRHPSKDAAIDAAEVDANNVHRDTGRPVIVMVEREEGARYGC